MTARVAERAGALLGHKQHTLELQLSFNAEVLHRKMVLPVVGQGLVKSRVLVLGDLLWIPHPNGLLLVDQGPLVADLLDLASPTFK